MVIVAVPAAAVPDFRSPALGLMHYQLRLPSFEGPLDVLLRLVEREQLPITDVSLVVVTEQFLAHVGALDGADPAMVAGFTSVAGRLLVLKSRSLLPRPTPEPEERDPDDLVRQLAEYRRMRDVANQLAENDRAGRGAFPRGGAVAAADTPPPRLAVHSPQSLARALRRRLALLAPAPGPAPLRATITLQAMLGRMLSALRPGRMVRLHSLAGGADREHLLVGFLAVLVLLRRRMAEAEQTEPFGDILVSAMPGAVDPEPAT